MKILVLFLSLIIPMTNTFASLNELSSWILKNHVKDSVDKTLSTDIVKALQKDIPNNKFIFLGEPDHYFHEKYTYRIAFIEELLKLGHYNIYAELGVADGMRVNKYLETGNEKFLKQVGLYGFKYGEPLAYRDGNFTKEIVRYFKELRKLKLKYPKLVYAGFDLDMYPGTAFLDFDEFAEREDVKDFSKMNKAFSDLLMIIEKAKTKEKIELKRLFVNIGYKKATEVRKEALVHIKDYDQFLFNYKVFKDSLTFFYESRKKPFNWGVFEWREERMFEIMEYTLKNEKPGEKYILLGHNGHLSKSNAENTNGDRYTTWDVIGAWITERFPKEVYSIWSFIGRGEHSGHGCPGRTTCFFDLVPGTLEEILYNISSEKALFFKNSAVVKRNEDLIKTVVNGEEVTSGKYGDYADAFYFIPEVKDFQP